MGKLSDDSTCWVVHDVLLYSVLDTVVISGDDVCCSVVFGTLVGVFMFSVMWSELLNISALGCPLRSLVYECQRVDSAFISPVSTKCGMCVMYVGVSHFVVRGCAGTRWYIIHVCYSDVFSVRLLNLPTFQPPLHCRMWWYIPM